MCLEDGPPLSLVSSVSACFYPLGKIDAFVLIWHQNFFFPSGWTTVWVSPTISFSSFSSPTPCCTVYSSQRQCFSISSNSGWWVSSVYYIAHAQHLIMKPHGVYCDSTIENLRLCHEFYPFKAHHFPQISLCPVSLSQGDLPNGPAKFHVLFLMFVALMFFVSLMFLFGYHCWLVAKNRSTLGEGLHIYHKTPWLCV